MLVKRKSDTPIDKHRRRVTAGAIALLAACGLIGVIAAMMWFRASKAYVELDDHLCPKAQGGTAYCAVIIDATDPLNDVQKAHIRSLFNATRDSIPRYGMLALFAVPDSPEARLMPERCLCKPERGDSVSALWGNPQLLQQRWNEEFERPIAGILDTILELSTAKWSPLMATIQAVTLHSSSVYDGDSKSLVIFSDMMEHSPAYSQYSGVPSFAEFRNSVYYARVRTDLTNWNVTIFYIRREDPGARHVQGRDHADFWTEYLSSLGAHVSSVQRVQG